MDYKVFQEKGLKIIREVGEVLTMIRYPYQAGNKDFFVINSKEEFLKCLEKREPQDSITLFKSTHYLTK